MDKIKETGYLAGFGTGIFGIFMALAGNSVGFSNLTGQGCGVIGIAFIALSIGSFIKPDSIGQFAMTILQNQQRAILGEQSSQTTTQTTHNESIGGSAVTVQGSNNRIIVTPSTNPTPNREENRRILRLFDDEVTRIEINLNAVPECTLDQQMVMYTFELYKRGNPQIFQNTPVYSQYSREMLQFSQELREKLIEFYEVIQTIHRNENFDYVPGTNNKFFQIKAYFDNIKKARNLIPLIKRLIQQELSL